MQKRIIWIDWAKVFCIYLMVCCHAGLNGLLYNLTYQFHMPAFFIMSGLLSRPKGAGIIFKSFCIPILFYSSITAIYRLLFGFINGMGVDYSIIESCTIGLIGPSTRPPFRGYWFVITLLLIKLLMELRFVRNNKLWIASACIVYCSVEPWLGLTDMLGCWQPYHIISCFPFFITGVVLREKRISVTWGSIEMKICLGAVFFILTLIQGKVDLAGYCYGVDYVLFFINALLGCYFLFGFCELLPQRNWIQVLSIGTFLILGFHGLLYDYCISLLHFIGVFDQYLPLLVGIMVLAVCYPVIVLFMRKCPILLGK